MSSMETEGLSIARENNAAVASESLPAQPVRLLLLDDHVLFRESLARLLDAEPGFLLVGGCDASSKALDVLDRTPVDVVLVDLDAADGFIAAARGIGYNGKFLIVASRVDVASSAMALRDGASGIFLESKSAACLTQAIRLVASGEAWVDYKVVQLLAERYPAYESRWFGRLTAREQTVLQGVVDGLTNRRIGDQIGASESTIKATLQQLFTKAGVRTRSQLVRTALEVGILRNREPEARLEQS